VDLIATGARLVEPDHRLLTGELYPPAPGGVSLRTFDPEPGIAPDRRFVVASAETIAYAVASGQVGDPRTFKRPVRVTVPRSLPTDDVLILRRGKSKGKAEVDSGRPAVPAMAARDGWRGADTLAIVNEGTVPSEPSVMLLRSLDSVRWVAKSAAALGPNLRAVVAEHIPSGIVPILAGLGIVALGADATALKKLAAETTIALPSPERVDGAKVLSAQAGNGVQIELTWLAVGAERQWTIAGGARPAPVAKKPIEAK
jgi:aconitate hydratase